MSDVNNDKKKQIQSAMTIEQQIANLQELGLYIEDVDSAAAFLNNVSYYRFIKAYSLGLKQKNGSFYSDVTFDQLEELYRFNGKFRQLLFGQIEKIEINLRCRVANYFSLKYGPLGYLEASNFETYSDKFGRDIQDEIKRNIRSPFIQNFKKNYENGAIPLYAVVEILSFGTLSKFYKNMKTTDKKEIACIYNVPYVFLESWVESIAYVRNVCAHYGRLYNEKLAKKPKLYRDDRKQGISNERIMGVLICMKHMLPNDQHWVEFINEIDDLFKEYSDVKINTMGFPENWKNLLLADE